MSTTIRSSTTSSSSSTATTNKGNRNSNDNMDDCVMIRTTIALPKRRQRHSDCPPSEGSTMTPTHSPEANGTRNARNYRSMRRRGAAVHSELLKNAFDASMDFAGSDQDENDSIDSASFHQRPCSFRSDGTSTVGDDEGPPRKRPRSADQRGSMLDSMLQHMVLHTYSSPSTNDQDERKY